MDSSCTRRGKRRDEATGFLTARSNMLYWIVRSQVLYRYTVRRAPQEVLLVAGRKWPDKQKFFKAAHAAACVLDIHWFHPWLVYRQGHRLSYGPHAGLDMLAVTDERRIFGSVPTPHTIHLVR